MDYIERSQLMKPGIISDSELLNSARRGFDEEIEPFSFGGTVNLYHVGILPSGLHVALRAFRPEMPEGRNSLTRQTQSMENFCQNAEHLDSEGEPVPAFCIGVVYKHMAGIFTEDLSAGETQEVDHDLEQPYALVGDEERKVFVDVDELFRLLLDLEPKYFLDENVVRI